MEAGEGKGTEWDLIKFAKCNLGCMRNKLMHVGWFEERILNMCMHLIDDVDDDDGVG